MLLEELDLAKPEEPRDGDEMTMLLAWLDFQRRTFLRKLRDLSPAQLADMAVTPLNLSILGLVRHMTQMEHVYLSRGLGGGSLTLAYSTDEDPEADLEDVDPGAAEADVRRYTEETRRADGAIAALPSLDSVGAGHGRSLRWTLIKMVQEYAVHNGQAHMIRYAALES